MSDFPIGNFNPRVCLADDLTCVLHMPQLCQNAISNKDDWIFGGAVTRQIVDIFQKAFPVAGGFCALPKIEWNIDKFMVSSGDFKGLVDGIEPSDVTAPFMVGFDRDFNRLFLTLRTKPSVITTFFQKGNIDAKPLDDPWFIGGGKGGPFEPFIPYHLSEKYGGLDKLRELAESGRTSVTTYRKMNINGTTSTVGESRSFFIE